MKPVMMSKKREVWQYKTKRTLKTMRVKMKQRIMVTKKVSNVALILSLLGLLFVSGCWLVVGAAGTGAAYEYKTKQQLDKLDQDYAQGNITKEEYEARKKEIEGGSIIY